MLLESQKHFQDYEMRSEVGADGKVKNIRVYIGDIYRLNVGRHEWIMTKLKFSAMYLLLALCCIGSLLIDITANKNALMSIAPICTMLLFCYGLRGIINLITSEQDMTRYCCEQVKECIGTSSYFLILTTGVSAAEGVIGAFWFGMKDESIVMWLVYAILHFASLMISWLIQHTSKTLKFLYIEGEKTKADKKNNDLSSNVDTDIK